VVVEVHGDVDGQAEELGPRPGHGPLCVCVWEKGGGGRSARSDACGCEGRTQGPGAVLLRWPASAHCRLRGAHRRTRTPAAGWAGS
jgi:hypothetical protein